MKHGDFTELAKHYVNRPGYSLNILSVIKNHIECTFNEYDNLTVAEFGAGTGKLTECLLALNLKGYSVEPNDAMREEGIKYTSNILNSNQFSWSKGTAEISSLPDSCAGWAIMGSSFHWADTKDALNEFNRILKPGGFFTAIYNPRNIEISEFHLKIEKNIQNIIPELKRVSSGSKSNMHDMEEKLLSSDYFGDLFFIEGSHIEIMSRDRYIGAWHSVNDIRVQAGEDRWQQILDMINKETKDKTTIEVPYKTRAWTVRKLR